MSSTGHYDQGELALFAMQLLSGSEYSAMAIHIADCTYCRQELAQIQGDLAAYAHTVETHSPPAQVRERFLNQIGQEKKSVALETPEPVRSESVIREERPERVERVEAAAPSFGYPAREQSHRTGRGSGRYSDDDRNREEGEGSIAARVFSGIFPWAGWVAAAGLAIVAGNTYHGLETQRTKLAAQATTIDRLNADAAAARRILDTITDTTAKQVTLTRTSKEAPPAVPQGRVTYSASKGALIFLASNLEPVTNFKTYELWLIPADGHDPIPAGTFRPDAKGNASVILPPLPKGIEAKMFGVTVEDDGGSQTPTMPILLAGS